MHKRERGLDRCDLCNNGSVMYYESMTHAVIASCSHSLRESHDAQTIRYAGTNAANAFANSHMNRLEVISLFRLASIDEPTSTY